MAWTEEDLRRLIQRGQAYVVEERVRTVRQRTAVAEAIIGHLTEPSQAIVLRLSMAPSVNHHWRSIIAGHGTRLHTKVLLSCEGRRYHFEAGMEVLRQWPHEVPRPLQGRLALDITLVPADRRSFDIDNRIKATMDLLQQAGVYVNDSQVDDLHVHRCPARSDGGYMLVRIEELVSPCE